MTVTVACKRLVDLYGTFIVVPLTQGAQVRITQFYLQIAPYLPRTRNRSRDDASTDWGGGHLIAAYYSFTHLSTPKGWKAESSLSGHLSAAGRVQDRESLPVIERRSTAVPFNQPVTTLCVVLVFCVCHREYLSSSARDPINVDCKVAETAKRKVAEHADRYCFVEAEVRQSFSCYD